MFERARARIARLISPAKPPPAMHGRMYHTAKQSRLTAGWGTTNNSSADTELVSSLTRLRSISRALVRDAAYAKRARIIVQNNVIGTGIGMQAQVLTNTGSLRNDVNDAIEEAFEEWCLPENCHTGGALHFFDLERAAMGQVFEAGEVLIREHYGAFGDSAVPYALELVEAERIADELSPGPMLTGAVVRMGVEVDKFGRSLAVYLRELHPGELRFGSTTNRVERVPAELLHHLRVIDRWPQTRGEPWLHAVARKLNDMDGYSEAEIVAARAAAAFAGVIETPETENPLGEKQQDGSREVVLEAGTFPRLAPGEKLNPYIPGRPNAMLDPFMRYMLREVASGVGVSYEALSRDYSQSNYSSSRLALLDDRDLWRVLQLWFIRNFRLRIHRRWLQQAVLARAITPIRVEEYAANPRKFDAVKFKPRGWSWIDPTKEVAAFKEAIKAGLTTRTDVIAQTAGGQDVEDIDATRRRELDAQAEKDLVYDVDPDGEGLYVASPAPAPAKDDDDEDPGGKQPGATEDDPPRRVVPFGR